MPEQKTDSAGKPRRSPYLPFQNSLIEPRDFLQ
jgi:hypothetical protein